MRVDNWLKGATSELKNIGVATARLDALILLEDSTHKDRSWLLGHPEYRLNQNQLQKLNRQIARRAKHEPLAYIRGFSEFYGRRFRLNRHVLEPRPESETMIDLLKKLPLPGLPLIADVGTGSGCLGITAALELPKALVDLYDIDSGALAVAKHNALLHELRLHAYKRDLLSRHVRNYMVVLANLPYVPNSWSINPAARLEPKIAIFGGSDGLDIYRRLFKSLDRMRTAPRFVLCESLPPQHLGLARIATTTGYRLRREQDFIQVFQKS